MRSLETCRPVKSRRGSRYRLSGRDDRTVVQHVDLGRRRCGPTAAYLSIEKSRPVRAANRLATAQHHDRTADDLLHAAALLGSRRYQPWVLRGSPLRLHRQDASDGKYLDEFTELVADTGWAAYAHQDSPLPIWKQRSGSRRAPHCNCHMPDSAVSQFRFHDLRGVGRSGGGRNRSTLESCGYVLRPMEPDGAAEVSAVSLTLKGVVCHDRLEVPSNWPPPLCQPTIPLAPGRRGDDDQKPEEIEQHLLRPETRNISER
jgi:hypothetical protein